MPVADMTPRGRLETAHPIVQVPFDLSKRQSAKTFAAILRGLMWRLGDYKRIGVICHREHAIALQATRAATGEV